MAVVRTTIPPTMAVVRTTILPTMAVVRTTSPSSETVRVIDLTKRTMRCAGIWPEEVHESKFIFFTTYLAIQCLLAIIDIAINISNLTYVVACSLENVFNLMALLKICICRIKRKSLTKLLQDIRTDFAIDNYKSRDEQMAFLNYNKFSQKFVKSTLIICFVSASSYFFMSLVTNVEMGNTL
ncbi:PREDICTED: uncharacterized protein LOC106792603 [Polistes canadensis]|uniref:uncharacterized protein LOC106792603 n=1 Tax=Polistes canadensis TaxID=91411 RepID=UPI000718D2C5|nr:PREDICTED: uncharacterized protein LOC106792603 [Polistes canadensis]